MVEPVLARAGTPFALVGHSYGAAVALIAAVANPGRIRALAMYEPTLFSLVDVQGPPPNGVDGIRNAVVAAGAALDIGDRDAAAGHFIDFWMGAGSWSATPSQRKPAIVDSVAKVRRWQHSGRRHHAMLDGMHPARRHLHASAACTGIYGRLLHAGIFGPPNTSRYPPKEGI